MAGEADTQLDIKPKAGMQFFTFTLKDALGREIAGQIEAPSEEQVRRFLADRGYELVESREGWYAMKFEQSPSARKAAVDERLEAWIRRVAAEALTEEIEAIRVTLLPAEDKVGVFHLANGEWQRKSDAPPDLWPALRERLAEMAGIELRRWEARQDGGIELNVGGAARTLEATFEGNTIGLRMLAG